MDVKIPEFLIVGLSEQSKYILNNFATNADSGQRPTIDNAAVMSCLYKFLAADMEDVCFDDHFDMYVATILEPLHEAGGQNKNVIDEIEIELEQLCVDTYHTLQQLGAYKLGVMPYEFDRFLPKDGVLLRLSPVFSD